jgi:hypothetical protein
VSAGASGAAARSVPERVAALDLARLFDALDADGFGVLPGFLARGECDGLVALRAREELFRKRIVMEQHGYGQGEYGYFAYPLPDLVAALRAGLYPPLVGVANRWCEALRLETRYPPEHASFLERCHAAGQLRPTPLLLSYRATDYNRLHQDLYGEHLFPLQVVFLLSEPGRDFEGGELVLTESRPRCQARPLVVPLRQGDGVVFAVRERPVAGRRGFHRVSLRHGVSRLHSGARTTLGIIFHDAE